MLMGHRGERDREQSNSDSISHDDETHATTGGSAVAGAVTGGLIGLAGGPVGAAIGAVGGAIVGVAAERIMHGEGEEDAEPLPMGIHEDVEAGPAVRNGDWDQAS
jgi:phage tail tape-measure protein